MGDGSPHLRATDKKRIGYSRNVRRLITVVAVVVVVAIVAVRLFIETNAEKNGGEKEEEKNAREGPSGTGKRRAVRRFPATRWRGIFPASRARL